MGRLVWERATARTSLSQTRNKERALMQTLAETFGYFREWPPAIVKLDKGHIPTLRALATAQSDFSFDELADLVQTHGSIRVWGQD